MELTWENGLWSLSECSVWLVAGLDVVEALGLVVVEAASILHVQAFSFTLVASGVFHRKWLHGLSRSYGYFQKPDGYGY